MSLNQITEIAHSYVIGVKRSTRQPTDVNITPKNTMTGWPLTVWWA